jgi:hypothetical protein
VHYPFDTVVNGKTKDFSWYKRDATVNGATLVLGARNKALFFDGNDYVQSTDVGLGPGAFTVSAWIKLNKTTKETGQASQIILSKSLVGTTWGPYALRVNADNKLEFAVYWENKQNSGVVVPTKTVLQKGNWYHIIVLRDAQNVHVFINGIEEGTYNIQQLQPYDSSTDLIIGATKKNDGSYQNYLSGSIDDVRIYSRALSAQEIKGLGLGYQKAEPK